ncbi:MAG: SIR2 family protein [Muribaculaceae bacterium]|nr:SIR2 family protein [Muribaculaceae bacterium]
MGNTDLIRNIISQNKDNIAFLIGNGIHYQFKDCELSWNELLKKLWCEHVDNREALLGDMSLTEIYDIIEISAIERFREDEYKRLIESLKNLSSTKFKDAIGGTQKDLSKIVQNLAQKSPNTPLNIKKIEPEILETFKKTNQELVHICREWCRSNIDGTESLTDAQCVNEMFSLLVNSSKQQIFRNSLKREVADLFLPKSSYKLTDCLSYIKGLNVPILTTNFDTYMSDSVGAKRFINNMEGQLYKFTDFYPWNVYYSTEKINENILDNFGIWHINGMTDYPRSIRLGLSDYMGCVERARVMIQGNNLNEYFTGKQQSYWKGYNTWLLGCSVLCSRINSLC